MKKILILIALALPILASAETTTKLGYVNTQELFTLLPEVKQVQSRMDSLNKQYEDMLVGMQEEYKKKVSDYEQKQATMTDAMKQIQEEELYTMQQRIQTAYQTAQQDLEQKRQEYLVPVQKKMIEAVKEVGEKNGYTYIFDSRESDGTCQEATGYQVTMADGYLESRYAEYEKRKAAWLKRKKYSQLLKTIENGTTNSKDPS